MPKQNRGPHLWWNDERQAWYIRWFESGRVRKRSTGFGRGEEAKAQEVLGRHLLDTERPGPRDPDQRRIADVLAGYATEHAPTTAYPQSIANSIERLLEWWGDNTLGSITEGACKAYCAERKVRVGKVGKLASRGTSGNDLIVLQSAIRHDYNKGRLTRLVPVWKPPRPEPRERWLTRSEVAKLIRAARASWWAREHLPLFILCAYYLAARKEAILSLRWPQVDFERGRVDLNPPDRPRTSKGRPTLPIPNRLMRFLRYARRRGSDTGFVITYHGGPVEDVRKGWKRAVERAGLTGQVTPHTLRHTAATHMAMGGVDLKLISLYLGHTSIRITERVYAKYQPEYLDDARAFFDRGGRR